MNIEGQPLDQIIQGDSIEVMSALPEKSVDLIFADPPSFSFSRAWTALRCRPRGRQNRLAKTASQKLKE